MSCESSNAHDKGLQSKKGEHTSIGHNHETEYQKSVTIQPLSLVTEPVDPALVSWRWRCC